MTDLLAAPQNVPFFAALAVMLGILALELVGTLLGSSLSGLLEGSIDLDAEGGLEIDGAEGGSALSRLFSWLRVGQVPVLMLLVVFLTSFGLIGLVAQASFHGLVGFYLPGWLMTVPAVLGAMPCTRVLGGAIAWLVPKDESSAVSADELVGRIAELTLTTARQGDAAEARVVDGHGQAHYVRVEPDGADDVFERGDRVLLVSMAGSIYRAIQAPDSLTRED